MVLRRGERMKKYLTLALKDFDYKVIPKFINAIKMVPKAQLQSAEKQKKCL